MAPLAAIGWFLALSPPSSMVNPMVLTRRRLSGATYINLFKSSSSHCPWICPIFQYDLQRLDDLQHLRCSLTGKLLESSRRVLKANIQGVASMDHFLPCSISFGVWHVISMAIAGVAAYKLKLWVVFKIQFECQAMISSHFTSRHPASRCFHSHRFQGQWKMQG